MASTNKVIIPSSPKLQMAIANGLAWVVVSCVFFYTITAFAHAFEPADSENQRGVKFKAKHWSFEPLPTRIEIPSLSSSQPQILVRNPIDAFVASEQQRDSLEMPLTADRAILARRASLMLTGQLPEAEPVQHFVQSQDVNAYENYVDSLIASPQFGERVAINWLALSRQVDTHDFQSDRLRDVWPYRDWVVSAINQDLPYDQFITWQLAGDMLPVPFDEQRLAPAFLDLHRQNEEGDFLDDEERMGFMTDRVNTLGTAILGLKLQCSRGHDGKHDSPTQIESFQRCDVFDHMNESGLASFTKDCVPGPTTLLLDKTQKQQVETLEKAIASVRQAYADEVKKLDKFDTVENWYGSLKAWPQPEDRWLSAEFKFDRPMTDQSMQFVNRVHADKPGSCEGTVKWQKDGKHSAVLLDGNNALVFPKSGVFSRTQEFTIALGLKVTKFFDQAVVLHRSQSWTDAGMRGYQLLIEDGHFHFDLVHFWPSSAIRIRCLEPVPLNQWMQIALVYGGTNRAEDTHIYIDGKRASVEITGNSLRKDFLEEQGDISLSIGARNGDQGLAGGLVDDLQVYDSALTAIEIAGLATDEPWLTWSELTAAQQTLWREHFAQRMDPQCKYHIESFQHYFKSLSEIVQNAPEMRVVNQALLNEGETMPKNRLELARWLMNNNHPLTARVAANQIWQQMFGSGLVFTADDFGVHGQPPTHPELLDYLARELIRSGWSRKAIFRLIATSNAFMSANRFQ